MDVGIQPPLVPPLGTPEFIARTGRAAEAAGFHSIWAPEHVVLFQEYESRYPYSSDGRLAMRPDGGVLDPFAVLTYIAAVTTSIRLGTGIVLVPQRNPVYTAKAVASLDWLSGGRVDFGVGIGWLREEFEALQVPWEKRGERTVDYLRVMQRLWQDEVSEHTGPYYRLRPARQYPKPLQQPHPPIYFGGESDAALGRVAEIGNGWYGYDLDPDGVRDRLAKLDDLLAAKGRSRSELRILACPYRRPATRDLLAEYEAAGVDEVVILSGARDADDMERRIEGLAREVL